MSSHEIKKIDYKKAFQESGKDNLFGLNVDGDGAELISNLLNDVNKQLCSNMDRAYNTESKIHETSFYHGAKGAIEEVFFGNIEKLALSEAFRQLTLHQSGCLTYRDDSDLSTLPKKPISDKSESKSHSYTPERLNFVTAVTDNLPSFIENAHISLTQDSEIKISSILKEAFDALVSHSIAAAHSTELDSKDIKASVCELFPGLLKDLAVACGSNAVLTWKDSNPKFHSPTSATPSHFRTSPNNMLSKEIHKGSYVA